MTIAGLTGRKAKALAIGLGLLIVASPAAGGTDLAGTPRIIDADTLEIAGKTLNLDGIDAPDALQVCVDAQLDPWKCGQEALYALIAHAGNKPWTCSLRGHDGFGERLVSCTVDGQDIAGWLVQSGWALSFQHCFKSYEKEQKEAENARLGLWRGAFIPPADWRNRNRRTSILGAVTVPVEAHKYLVPDFVPMSFKAATGKPACYKSAPVNTARQPAPVQRPSTAGLSAPSPTQNPPASSSRACRNDLSCFAMAHAELAAKACARQIERIAANDFQWINQWHEKRFERYRWRNPGAGIITYFGDKIRYKDGQDNWIRHSYECDFDAPTNRVLYVRALPYRPDPNR